MEMTGRAGPDLVKIFFRLGDDAPTPTETLWARPLGDRLFELNNSPFYAFGVSYLDKVFAAEAGDGALEFSGVAERGGHSTYRVFLEEGVSSDQFEEYWKRLERLGCSYEGAKERLFSIDVPPAADIYQVYSILEEGEAAGRWDFEEAHVGHELKQGPLTSS